MLQFQLETVISKPVEEVTQLFTQREHFSKWQPWIIKDEKSSGDAGSQSHKLTWRIGRRNTPVEEKVLLNQMPGHYHVQYKLKGIIHVIRNHFTNSSAGSTLWATHHELHFRGIMVMIGPFMKRGLIEQSTIIMRNFKSFAEHFERK